MVVSVVRGRHWIPRPVSLSFADHFSTDSARYATYRPHYPQALADALAERCTVRDAAWDAGCGTGQLSVALAPHFTRVFAHDPSQAQIDAAEPHPQIEYRCAPAEQSGLADASVDLAVAAQAAHWFDWPRYVAEVARVTRPGGLVALVSYGILHVAGEADAIVARYYHDDAGPYWPKGREHVENGYRDLVWPWSAVAAPAPRSREAATTGVTGEREALDMSIEWTREELLGYVATWSATVKLVDAKGPTPYQALADALAAIWPDGEKRVVRWPLTIRLARR